jgi:hypothetical protein
MKWFARLPSRARKDVPMPVTGELIRLTNFVDDITNTLRRISANIPSMTAEERRALAEYMRKATPGYDQVLKSLEKENA